MRSRIVEGLPPLPVEGDDPDEPTQQRLEAGMIDACREVGTMLVRDGNIAQGWMYLRPVGDTAAAREAMADVEVTDDNAEDMIGVLLHEGVDVARGYRAMLERNGTCNAITIYEQSVRRRGRADRIAAAGILLEHLHDELRNAVAADVRRRGGQAGDDASLNELLDANPELMKSGGYHMDTTHIASVVGISRVLEERRHLETARSLCRYGRSLDASFQYPGEEPFRDFYPSHHAYFSTLLGDDVDAGLRYFRDRARSVDPEVAGPGAIETYVELLDRVGRHAESVRATVEMTPAGVPAGPVVATMLPVVRRAEVAGQEGAPEMLAEFCRSRGDSIGYAAVMLDGG